ncbi:alginate export family protein [Sphingomonas sp. RP10(2022)]|uniref:Alginate export family protein n=1 Tax=Sphingomonas liriopis TaxID=2949094 RepID=A0A9X2HUK0_9SPHN|nr:alginate export family protein [Sphingomonas liriopis]MCP3735779.1 alginate export family protein [Sphingomonas liriopis]
MRLAPFALLSLCAAPAAAQTVTPLAEARLRYEHVEQDGLPQDSDAVTVRVRTGVQAAMGRFSALVQAQGNLAILPDYFDGLHGPATLRPLVADPQNIAIYRAQLRYAAPGVALTAGRQTIVLDDERFVGTAGMRNNSQSFDAVRAELSPVKGIKADVSYVWSIRTINGIDGRAARPTAINGDTVLANLGWASPIGTLTGFAYLIDEDAAAVQGYRLSSQTYGGRLAGARAIGKAKLAYQLSYARQSDYHRNPNRYAADYWLADVGFDLNGPKLGAGYEVLGADTGRNGGVALTSFQTPLSSIFKFQGWADKFTTTPADGIRDAYASAGWGWKQLGTLKAVSLTAVYHRFESDRLVRHYGDEIDLLASARIGRTTASLRYADYNADRLFTDTSKLWLQLDWSL